MNIRKIIYASLTLLLLSASAAGADTCYSVELLSVHESRAAKLLKEENSYPPECKLMKIGEYFTMRCGCYEKKSAANETLSKYYQFSTTAFATLTKKERFDSNVSLAKAAVASAVVAPKAKKLLRTPTKTYLLDASSNLNTLTKKVLKLPSDLLYNVQILRLKNGNYYAYTLNVRDMDLLMSIEGRYREFFPYASLVFLEGKLENARVIFDYSSASKEMKKPFKKSGVYVKAEPKAKQLVPVKQNTPVKRAPLKQDPNAKISSKATFFLDKSGSLDDLTKKLSQLPNDLLSYVQVLKSKEGEFSAYTLNMKNMDILLSRADEYKRVFAQSAFIPLGNDHKDKELVLDYSTLLGGSHSSVKNNNIYDLSYFGEHKPKVANRDDIHVGTPQNRRVEIEVYSKDEDDSAKKRKRESRFYNYGLCRTIPYSGKLKKLPIEDIHGYLYKESHEKKNKLSLIDFDVSEVEDIEDMNHSFEDSSITELMAMLKKNNSRYLGILQDKDPFIGLYLGGTYAQFLAEDSTYRKNVDYEYRVKLRWELFKDGYFDSQTGIEKNTNETEVQYLQLLSDMINMNYDDKVFYIQGVKLEVRSKYYALVSDAYEELLTKREGQLRDGFTTIDDVNYVRERLENFRMLKELNTEQDRKKMDRKLFLFLNSIECVNLVDKEWLKSYIIENSTDLQLQDRFIKRADFTSKFSDRLKLNVFAEHRKVDTLGWYNTAGVQIDIPLDWNDERNDVMKLEKANYKIKKSAMQTNIRHNTDSLYYQFDYQQKQLKIYKNMLRHLYQREEQLEAINAKVIDGFNINPDRERDLISIKIIDKKYEILMKRIEVYEILLRLYHLSNADNIKFLIQNRLGE